MPMPSRAQAAIRPARLDANASMASPAAKTRLVAVSASRSSRLSIVRPASGPSRPNSSSAAEKSPQH
jgi:hypothetical protein